MTIVVTGEQRVNWGNESILINRNIDPEVRKPVFGVSHNVRFKPASSATETSLRIEISLVAYDSFQSANNKGYDQSARMCRLI